MLVVLCCILGMLLCASVFDNTRTAVYTCNRTDIPPTIDGKLDDEAWAHIPATKLVLSCTGPTEK